MRVKMAYPFHRREQELTKVSQGFEKTIFCFEVTGKFE